MKYMPSTIDWYVENSTGAGFAIWAGSYVAVSCKSGMEASLQDCAIISEDKCAYNNHVRLVCSGEVKSCTMTITQLHSYMYIRRKFEDDKFVIFIPYSQKNLSIIVRTQKSCEIANQLKSWLNIFYL